MKDNKKIESILKLERMVFDKIEFTRMGFKNDQELELQIQSSILKRQDAKCYKVVLALSGEKPQEYTFNINLSGYFSIETDDDLTDDLINTLISKNSVAILMPYLRSQVSLLTAQPEVECVVLPAFNINNMLEKDERE